jgi:hypothetical protein
MALEFLTDDEFEALPENKPAPKTDEFWDPIIEALGERKIVKIPFTTEKEKRGRRLAAGRRSKKAGFPIEIRYGEDFFAVRQMREPVAAAIPEKAPNGRRRKTTDD